MAFYFDVLHVYCNRLYTSRVPVAVSAPPISLQKGIQKMAGELFQRRQTKHMQGRNCSKTDKVDRMGVLCRLGELEIEP